MAFVVHNAPQSGSDSTAAIYEQPLNERMRTFLRLEFLHGQTEHHVERESEIDTREAIAGILEIAAILGRGDVRSDVLKELERHIGELEAFVANPNVDRSRVESLLVELRASRQALNQIGPHYLQPLKQSEFLNAIQHRSAIPGGTCEFDLPLFSHWLRQPYETRLQHLEHWLGALRPLCDAVRQSMWLVRQSARSLDCTASGGMYHHSLARDTSCRMLRVHVDNTQFFPEISGSPQRFTIRFLQWSDIESRPTQSAADIAFKLSIC